MITKHKLYNILRSTDKQTVKLIEYNMRNSFLRKSYSKCDGEASPRFFYKKSELNIFLALDQHSEKFKSLFLLYV